MRSEYFARVYRALFGGPFRWAKELKCRVSGHNWERKAFDGRGRRIEVTCCTRCRQVDRGTMQVSCLNRRVRRQAARAYARELLR